MMLSLRAHRGHCRRRTPGTGAPGRSSACRGSPPARGRPLEQRRRAGACPRSGRRLPGRAAEHRRSRPCPPTEACPCRRCRRPTHARGATCPRSCPPRPDRGTACPAIRPERRKRARRGSPSARREPASPSHQRCRSGWGRPTCPGGTARRRPCGRIGSPPRTPRRCRREKSCARGSDRTPNLHHRRRTPARPIAMHAGDRLDSGCE